MIEDAAHCLLASYRDRPLGTLGDLGTFSFHHTKNVSSGEGGALLVNNPALLERAEVVWEKGTDRTRFERGEVDRYTWVDIGSSFAASELTAAFLWGQLEAAEEITRAPARDLGSLPRGLRRARGRGAGAAAGGTRRTQPTTATSTT